MCTVVLPRFDAKAYSVAVQGQDGADPDKEASLQIPYPVDDISISQPTTIIDKWGKMVAWLLPELLSAERQVHLAELFPPTLLTSSGSNQGRSSDSA